MDDEMIFIKSSSIADLVLQMVKYTDRGMTNVDHLSETRYFYWTNPKTVVATGSIDLRDESAVTTLFETYKQGRFTTEWNMPRSSPVGLYSHGSFPTHMGLDRIPNKVIMGVTSYDYHTLAAPLDLIVNLDTRLQIDNLSLSGWPVGIARGMLHGIGKIFGRDWFNEYRAGFEVVSGNYSEVFFARDPKAVVTAYRMVTPVPSVPSHAKW